MIGLWLTQNSTKYEITSQGFLLIKLDEYNKNYNRTSTATVEAVGENSSTAAMTAIEVSHINYD